MTKLNQSGHVVYLVQPVVMAYTHKNLWYTPCYWDSVKFGDLSIILIDLVHGLVQLYEMSIHTDTSRAWS